MKVLPFCLAVTTLGCMAFGVNAQSSAHDSSQSCAMESPTVTQLRLRKFEGANTSFAVNCQSSYAITFNVTYPADGTSALVNISNPSVKLPVQYTVTTSDTNTTSDKYINHAVIEPAGQRTYIISATISTPLSSNIPAGEYTGNISVNMMF